MAKSSVSRLLRTLGESELLERAEDGSYCAGPRALQLAALYRARYGMREAVIETLDGLVTHFGFTGFVSVLSGSSIVLLHVRQGSHPLRYVREEGTRLPAWQTAMGHVLLARLPDAAVADRLRDAGPIDLARLRRALASVRRRGFILAGSMLTRGVTTIAAAVTETPSGEPIALALAYADTAVDARGRDEMTAAILDSARRLESSTERIVASTSAAPI